MSLFPMKVSGKAGAFVLDLEDQAFWLQNATMTRGSTAALYVSSAQADPIPGLPQKSTTKTGSQKFCLGHFNQNHRNLALNHRFDSEEVTFSVVGDGELELLGVKQNFANPEFTDSDDDSDGAEQGEGGSAEGASSSEGETMKDIDLKLQEQAMYGSSSEEEEESDEAPELEDMVGRTTSKFVPRHREFSFSFGGSGGGKTKRMNMGLLDRRR